MKWVQESVKSHDFNELKSVALFFAHADLAVGLLFPNSNYREEVYLQLFNENDRIASNMVSSDFAFNWKDKEGVTVMQRLGHCFERMGDAVTAHSLSTIRGIRLDCYRVVASKDGKLTLMNKDNEQYAPVVVTTPMPDDTKRSALYVRWWDGMVSIISMVLACGWIWLSMKDGTTRNYGMASRRMSVMTVPVPTSRHLLVSM